MRFLLACNGCIGPGYFIGSTLLAVLMYLAELKQRLRKFTTERDWEQFHSPKNLSMALSVEVAELLEHFQWLTEAQSRSLNQADLKEVETEIADILIYLTLLADKLGIDMESAINAKIEANAIKYPVSGASPGRD